jgi:hypothetical protein
MQHGVPSRENDEKDGTVRFCQIDEFEYKLSVDNPFVAAQALK